MIERNKYLKQFGIANKSLYICFLNPLKMKKKQIQSYISEEQYEALKSIAENQGLLFATLVRQILINYLKTNSND